VRHCSVDSIWGRLAAALNGGMPDLPSLMPCPSAGHRARRTEMRVLPERPSRSDHRYWPKPGESAAGCVGVLFMGFFVIRKQRFEQVVVGAEVRSFHALRPLMRQFQRLVKTGRAGRNGRNSSSAMSEYRRGDLLFNSSKFQPPFGVGGKALRSEHAAPGPS